MVFTVIGKRVTFGIFNGVAYKDTIFFVTYQDPNVDGLSCTNFKIKGLSDIEIGQDITVLVDNANRVTGVRLAEGSELSV